jgi:signal transduction histidine kinase
MPDASALGELSETLHDVRNHLNAVLGLMSLILLQSRDEAVVRHRALVEEQSEHLRYLVDRLIDPIARRDGASAHAAPVDPSRFVPALVDLYAPYAAEHGMRLKFRVEPGTPCLSTDGRALHRVLSNLLVNAIKHSQASLVVLRALPIEVTRPQSGVQFIVVDDGVGIEPQAQQSLNRVLAGDRELAPEYDRSGLAIVARLARALGATAAIDSQLDDGTTVTVAVSSRSSADATRTLRTA